MLRFVLVVLAFCVGGTFGASAQQKPAVDRCLALSQNAPRLMHAGFVPVSLKASEARLTFIGHSTFLIESAGGVKIATDYNGVVKPTVMPDIVTMNHAHTTHYTDHPEPEIKHVLRGWNPAGGAARHDLTYQDVRVRNVPTNIRTWGTGGTEHFGNSIFVFEMAGLCIGHLGHLHHTLTTQQIAQVGQLDVVLVPVDGSYTLDVPGMLEVLKALRARLMIPMHYFGAFTLNRFIDQVKDQFEIRTSETPTVVVSHATLPRKPQMLVLPGH